MLLACVEIRIGGLSVLRANISLIVIVLSLTGSIGSAVAQYLPAQPPPVGYPPPASYPYPASPPRYPGADPLYSDQYEDPYNDLYPPRPPRLVYPPPYAYPASQPRYPGAYSYGAAGPMPPPRGTAVAALPSEYQPEGGSAKTLPARFQRTMALNCGLSASIFVEVTMSVPTDRNAS